MGTAKQPSVNSMELNAKLFMLAMQRYGDFIKDRPYPKVAYEYIYMSFPRIRKMIEEATKKNSDEGRSFYVSFTHHISGQDLCKALRKLMLDDYGIMICDILNHWQIKTTHDIGVIVSDLVAIKLFAASPEDNIHDFDDIFPIDSSLWCKPELPNPGPLPPCPVLP